MFMALASSLCFTALLPGTANGQLIGDPMLNPDIVSFFMAVNYTESSGLLTVTGDPEAYNPVFGPGVDISPSDPGSRSFNLSATLTPSSISPVNASGTMSIYGSIIDGPPELLLAGTIDRVGGLPLEGNGALIDFSFHPTGGSLKDEYTPNSGIQLSLWYYNSPPEWNDVAFTSFQNDFSYNGLANTSDTYATPEPSSAAMALAALVTGLAASVWRRARTRRV